MKLLLKIIAVCTVLSAGARVNAQVTVGVDPGAAWLGYMNVSELPENGGASLWGSPWGTVDLCAVFTGPVLKITPNAINDPNPYWYTPSGGPGATGNKIMGANFYVEDSVTLPGQFVTFTGNVTANTLDPAYSCRAFVKDFAPDYSSFTSTYVDLTPGVFEITLSTQTGGRHAQYGFETIGPCVWITDLETKGFVTVTAVTPPAPPTAKRALRIAAGLDPAPTPETGAEFIALNVDTTAASETVIDIADAVALAKAGKP